MKPPVDSVSPHFIIPDNSISKPSLHPLSERILNVLRIAARPLTTRQISHYSGVSYVAVQSRLLALSDDHNIIIKKLKNRTYWRLP